MRQEVKEFVKISERLMILALQTNELSEEECQILDYHVTELKRTVHPICIRKASAISLPSSST